MHNAKLPISEIRRDLINTLARSYSVLDYSYNLRKLISTVFPQLDLNELTKKELLLIINNLLIKYHQGEEVIKYNLLKSHINKNHTIAFEIKVNRSRVDFLAVNGYTTSYEIKSKLDNLNKLETQIKDYEKVFEYNYLVLDERHIEIASKIIPQNFGIFLYRKGKNILIKEALKNDQLDAKLQLQIFTKGDLKFFFNNSDSRQFILSSYSNEEINQNLKLMFKKRYQKRVEFIKSNRHMINPIDFHFFFHNNIPPQLIYGVK